MTLGRVAVELQLGAVSSTIRIDTQRVYSMYLYIPYVAHGGRHSGFFSFFSFLFHFVCTCCVVEAFISFQGKKEIRYSSGEGKLRSADQTHRLVALSSLSLLRNCYFHLVGRRRRKELPLSALSPATYRFSII